MVSNGINLKRSLNVRKSHKKVLINPDFILFCRFIIKDRETFFSSAQRSQMVWQILMRTSYDDDDSDKVGIIRLLSNGVFKDAYPLHDGRAMKDDQQKGHHCSRRVSFINFSTKFFVSFSNVFGVPKLWKDLLGSLFSGRKRNQK